VGHDLLCLSDTACFVCFALAAFLTQTVCLDDVTVKFEIWDTAGQERYHSLAPMYYRGAQAAIIVYDVSCRVRLRRNRFTESHFSFMSQVPVQ